MVFERSLTPPDTRPITSLFPTFLGLFYLCTFDELPLWSKVPFPVGQEVLAYSLDIVLFREWRV